MSFFSVRTVHLNLKEPYDANSVYQTRPLETPLDIPELDLAFLIWQQSMDSARDSVTRPPGVFLSCCLSLSTDTCSDTPL